MRVFIWKVINVVVLIAAVIGILYPAFLDPKITFTRIFVSLFEPDLTIGFASRWLIVIVFIASLYAIIISGIYKNVWLTILRSHIEIKYLTHDGSRVRLRKEQTIRANQRDVTAFFNTHATSTSHGRIPKTEISSSVFSDFIALNERREIYGQENRSLEVIQIFSQPLPFVWFMPLIPVFFLRAEYDQLPRFLRRYIVRRTNTAVYENEFNIEAVMQFTAETYTSHNVMLSFDFSATDCPPKDSIVAMRIKNHAVIPLMPDYDAASKRFVFRIGEMRNERIRISWPIPFPAPVANTP